MRLTFSLLTVAAITLAASSGGAQDASPSNADTNGDQAARSGDSDGAVDDQAGAPADARSDERGERWRYRYHRGRWWYWMPDNSWVYWTGDGWRRYDPTAIARRMPRRIYRSYSYEPSVTGRGYRAPATGGAGRGMPSYRADRKIRGSY